MKKKQEYQDGDKKASITLIDGIWYISVYQLMSGFDEIPHWIRLSTDPYMSIEISADISGIPLDGIRRSGD